VKVSGESNSKVKEKDRQEGGEKKDEQDLHRSRRKKQGGGKRRDREKGKSMKEGGEKNATSDIKPRIEKKGATGELIFDANQSTLSRRRKRESEEAKRGKSASRRE